MKNSRTIRNLGISLCVFVFWGNLVSLFLPMEEYGAVIKMIDFASALFVLAVLISAVIGIVREQRAREQETSDKENPSGHS